MAAIPLSKKATELSGAENYIIKIAEKLPNYDIDSSGDLRSEIWRLKSERKKYFSEELNIYISNCVPGFKLME